MFRFVRAIYYYFTGTVNSWADAWSFNPAVMAATYDTAINNSSTRYTTVRNAVAKLINIESERTSEVNALHERAKKLQHIKNAAFGKAKDFAAALTAQGKTEEEIKKEAEYVRHMGAFTDASNSLKEIVESINSKEKEIVDFKSQIASYKVQLQSMQRSSADLRQEKEEALADVAIAQEIQAVNDVLSGVAENTIDKDLKSAREARKTAKSKAKITAELAGNDAAVAEAEYLNYSKTNESASEFESLIFANKTNPEADLNPAKLPE